MVEVGVEGGRSAGIRVTGRDRVEHSEAGGGATGSTPRRRLLPAGPRCNLRGETEGLMGDGDDWVAGMAED